MDIVQIFNTFAFPTAVVVALMWYVVKLTENHSKESSEFIAALNRNTVVLERLCAMLGDKEGTVNDQQVSQR